MTDKTPGQIAYELELTARPNYDDGNPRRSWHELLPIARWSWERKPAPRWTVEAGR